MRLMGITIPFVREMPFAYGEVAPVSPLVRRVVARNPSLFTLYGTNTYLVGSGRVMVIDPSTEEMRVGFDAQSPDGAKVIAEWNRRGAAGEPRLELMSTGANPELPGLLTGLVMTPEGRLAYISNLGNALVRVKN